MAPQPPDSVLLLTLALIGTAAVTTVLSLAVVWWYRRAIGRSMRTAAHRSRVAVPPVSAGVPDRSHARARPTPVVVLDETHRAGHGIGATEDDLWRRSRRRLHATVVVYVAAGLAFGLVGTTVQLTAAGVPIGPQALLATAMLFAWPLVPTVLAVAAAAWPTQVLAWIGYAALLLLATAGLGITPVQAGVLAWTFAGAPALMLLALSSRPIRAVGPFLAVPMLLTTAGLLLWPDTTLWAKRLGAAPDVAEALGLLGAGLLGLAGFAHLARTARRYARKRAGDQMLMISQWWLLAVVWQSVLLFPYGIGPALAVWAAYLTFQVVLGIGMRLRGRPTGPPRRLLLLRTSGARRRGEALLRRLGAHWRHVGTISMIAGPDLASTALEPHEFLDLLRGRLSRRFIGNAYELRGRVAELHDQHDPDGRYRVGEVFCHDDMWRPALQQLLRHTDCVLLDARGFARRHEGVTHEITQLAQLVPLNRVLVLVDDTTDQYVLRAAFDRARLDPVVPDPGGSLRLLRTHAGRVDPAAVVAQLGRTAV